MQLPATISQWADLLSTATLGTFTAVGAITCFGICGAMIRAKLEDWEIERKSRPFDVPKHDEKQIHFAITFIPMSNSPASHGLYEHSFSSTHCEKDFKGFLEMNHTVSNWFEKNFSEARFVVSPIGHRVEYSKNQHGYEMDGVLISTDNPNAAVMAKMQFGGAQ